MVSSTCEKCGAVLRHDEDAVPPSGMVVKCPACAEPVTVLPESARGGALGEAGGAAAAEAGDILDLGDPLDLADLPEVPAPARPSAAPSSDGFGADGGIDLPAPRATSAGVDLPAPKSTSPFDTADLPAPVARRAADADLPAPVATSRGFDLDLPAPARSPSYFEDDDLPAPVAHSSAADADLPAPKGVNPFDLDLPMPKEDVPDLLEPVEPVSGLPQPKGAMENLPGPKARSAPAEPAPLAPPPTFGVPEPEPSSGGFDLDSLELSASDGHDISFDTQSGEQPFDLGEPIGADSNPLDADLGGGRGGAGGDAGGLDLDGGLDLGGGDAGDAGGGGLDLGGGGGLDLGGGGAGGGGLDGGLDLGGGDLGGGGLDGGLDLDGGEGRPFGLDSLDLEAPESGSAPEVPLSMDDLAGSDRFGELDLPGGGGDDDVVTFSKPSGRPGTSSAPPMPGGGGFHAPMDDALELDTSPEGPTPAAVVPEAVRARQQERAVAESSAAASGKKSARRRQLVAAAALVVVAIGAGGFYAYQGWTEEQEQSRQLALQLRDAEKALATDAPEHWTRAISAAERAAAAGTDDATPHAILAEARFAAAVDTGRDVETRVKKGNEALAEVRKRKGRGLHVDKAQGLQALAERRPGEALKRLGEVARLHADDVNAQLYFGWANAAAHRYKAAATAFRKALALSPNHIAAHYGLGRALVELGAKEEAEASFHAIIQRSRDAFKRDHIGAMVGVAQLAEVDRFSDRENRFLEILENQSLAKADPRAVAQAWALAGDEALRAGRVAVGAERYARALKLDPLNLGALIGQAKVARAEGKQETAADRLQQVLSLAPGHIDASLLLAEVTFERGDPDAAAERLAGLYEHEPPIEDAPTLTRMHILRGHLLATDETAFADAEAAFRAAMESAASTDIRPALALAELYVQQERNSDAVALLQPVRQAAESDPELALSLGRAYLGTGDHASAGEFFQRAVDLRPSDPEAHAQLGRALLEADDEAAAIAALRQAYTLSEHREDIGLELAGVYQELGRAGDAAATFEEILAQESPSLTARGAAGRFYASEGDTTRAAEVGESILAEDPKNAAGLFLTGEAYFAQGAYLEARERFGEALLVDGRPQYHEAAARASEHASDFEDAMRHYERAVVADPDYVAPRLGQIRILVARREFGQALEAIAEAKEVTSRLPRSDELTAQRATLFALEGESYLELRNFAQAVTSLESGLRVDADHGRSHYLLGRAYANLGKNASAASALSRATRVAGGDEDWLPDAYRRLGYAHREAGNRGGAVTAFQRYLDLEEGNSTSVTEVKRLLVGLQGR